MSKKHWNKRFAEIKKEIINKMNVIESRGCLGIREWYELKRFIEELEK